MATKKELRAQYKQLRRELPSGTAAEFSAAVCEAVVRSREFRSATTVHLFLPIRRQGEVDTFPILEEIFRRGKTAVVSVSDFSTNLLSQILKPQIKSSEQTRTKTLCSIYNVNLWFF